MATRSPYADLSPDKWLERTKALVQAHPLNTDELVDVVLASWTAIFKSRIGPRDFNIGKDIFPKPQILGFLLHELIPLELEARYPDQWRRDEAGTDKDLVFLRDPSYSVEIKTSSSAGNIYGNRSYAQENEAGRKDKSGYYLAVNFQKCEQDNPTPAITSVRFGWLDHSDWVGQKAATGQQARLAPAVEATKLLKIYSG